MKTFIRIRLNEEFIVFSYINKPNTWSLAFNKVLFCFKEGSINSIFKG